MFSPGAAFDRTFADETFSSASSLAFFGVALINCHFMPQTKTKAAVALAAERY
jgi:hypothetical protein